MKLTTTLIATVLLSGICRAQTPCHAEFDGNVFQNNVSMGGPNFTNCIKSSTSKALVVFAVQVFTGEKTGTSTVGLWSHDAAKDEPKAELARGSWSMSATNSWQGANLSKPVILPQGTTFWVSWIPVNGSQATVQNTGKTLPGIQTYKWSRTNSAPWNGPFKDHQWKFRLWCVPLGSITGVTVIGNGCSDGFGKVGTWAANQTPSVGNQSFQLLGKDLPPASKALVFVGLKKTMTSIDLGTAGAFGCFLHSDSVVELLLQTTAGTPSKSDGTLTLPAAIPNDTSLKGFFFRTQLAVADANSRRPLPAIFTNGLGITIQ
ncbi:MAG: hypothetical protein ACYTKC_07655 [Planctomycetota bacterium]|jgi:hypothetical protein